MDPQPNINDLLSGMLDGILSDEEYRQLEAAMAADMSIEKQLNALSRMRKSLLVHRPKGHLNEDFARRVVMLSRARARSSTITPAWLPAKKLVLRPWIYVSAAAATIVVCIFAQMSARNKFGDFASGSTEELHSEKSEIGGENENIGNSDVSLLANDSNPTLQAMEPSTVSTGLKPDGNQTVIVNSNKKHDEVNTITASPKTNNNATVNNRDLEEVLTHAKTKLEADLSTTKFLAIVIDISVTTKAIENQTLESILNRHDIASTGMQILSAEQLSALEDSQLTGNAKAAGHEEIGVMFIRAPGPNLNQAIIDIINEQEAFPDFSMDLSADNSLRLLLKELSSIRFATGNLGEARNLGSAQAGNSLLPFKASGRKAGLFSRKTMKSGAASLLKQESRQLANALLTIRTSN